MKATRVAIYVRASTNEQDTEGQEAELREYVESRGWTYAPSDQARDENDHGHTSGRHRSTRPQL
jgi:DNA invertase Pin-like site-specific DNA recombinase